jgi:hypothetical protein
VPLKKGKGKTAVNDNIREMMRSYKETGRIGNTTPADAKHAAKIASAAAYRKARGG